MNKYKIIKSLSIASLITLSIGSIFPTTTQAKITFEPPKLDRPTQSAGGASRGNSCVFDALNTNNTLRPLLPSTNQGLTVASHPTLLVHVPKTNAKTAFLAVRDITEEYDYQTIVPIGDRGGIVSLTLPESAPDLELGKNYQWSLVLMCDGKLKPDSPVAQGSIKRVALNLNVKNEAATADMLENADLYARSGIWYETIATLAKLKIAQPNNNEVTATWEEFLGSVGLSDVAKAEFVE